MKTTHAKKSIHKNILKNEAGFAPLAILGLVAVLGLGTAGTVAASDSAIPGDALYPIDKLSEQVKLALTNNEVAQAKVYAQLSAERLEELEELLAENPTSTALQNLPGEALQNMQMAQERANSAQENGKDVSEVQALITQNMERQQQVLQNVYERVPEQAKPAIERAIQNSQRGFEEAMDAVQKRGNDEEESENGSEQTDGTSPTTQAPVELPTQTNGSSNTNQPENNSQGSSQETNAGGKPENTPGGGRP